MKVVLGSEGDCEFEVIAEAEGDTLRRALSRLADNPEVRRVGTVAAPTLTIRIQS